MEQTIVGRPVGTIGQMKFSVIERELVGWRLLQRRKGETRARVAVGELRELENEHHILKE